MNKVLINKIKSNYMFFISLVFFVFPLVYIVNGSYPIYILPLTIMAIVSYISILFTENKYIIFIEWFYLVFYIAFMALYINPTNMLFSFYLSNLLVWRFHDDYTTYRFISFFIVINAIMIHISLTSLYLGDKVIMFCFYFLCLITYFLQKRGYERNKLKNERNKYNEHINVLLAENERNRIGQDLHDSIGHTFVMLKLKAELAEKYLQKNNIEAAKKELSEISKISKESMDNTRAIVNKLKHRTVEEEIKIIQDIMIMSDIQLDLNNNFVTKPIGLQEWTITMILKELTNNIIKHSKANKCNIILDESNNNYTITAKDNGCGFEILTGSELASIRERIKVVDGKIEILSKKEPTIIRVTISKDS